MKLEQLKCIKHILFKIKMSKVFNFIWKDAFQIFVIIKRKSIWKDGKILCKHKGSPWSQKKYI
jgi:hypothetical protein